MNMRAMIAADARTGLAQPPEDLVIAALVMAPFALTLAVLLGWMLPLPAWLAIGLFVVLLGGGTLWNAGWRARTSA